MLSYTSICVRSKISISHRLCKVAQALRAAVPRSSGDEDLLWHLLPRQTEQTELLLHLH